MSDLLESLVSALQERVIPIDVSADKAVAVANDFRMESLENFQDRPFRQRGSQSFQSLASMLSYAEAYAAEGETAVFADTDGLITAVLNWHSRAIADQAGWGDHRAEYKLHLTPEWLAWSGINGKAMTQTFFAEFLEEHSGEVSTPDPAVLLDAVTKLSGKRNISFESSKNLGNGDTAIVWKEETTAGGTSQGDGTFPSEFKIKLPIYKGAEKATTFEIKALLRYRADQGKVSFEVKLLHVDKIKDEAFEELLASVRESVNAWPVEGIPVYTGKAAKL